jgi:hypothetical protein
MSEYISFFYTYEFCLSFGAKIGKFGLRSRFDRFDRHKNNLTEMSHKRYIIATVTKLTVRISNLSFKADTQSYLLRLFLCLQYMMVLCYIRRCGGAEKLAAFPALSGITNPAPVFPFLISNENERFNTQNAGDFAHA